jgi:phosphatidylethanolamine-binding protein (PEBP) family uncharacterized protein
LVRSILRTRLILVALSACTLEVQGGGAAESAEAATSDNNAATGDPATIDCDPATAPETAEQPREATDAGSPSAEQADASLRDAAHPEAPSDAGRSRESDAGTAASIDAGRSAPPDALTLKSDALTAGGHLPDEHTCRGVGGSPPLSWSAGPAGTRSYAIALRTRNASQPRLSSVVLWVVWDIHGLMLPQGIMPGGMPSGQQGMRQASLVTSSFATLDMPHYQAPCSIVGSQDFEFVLYALAVETLPVAQQANADAIVQQIETDGSLLATSSLPFTFP